MSRVSIYEKDLAHIHIAGYGFHWEAAAPTVLAWMRRAGIDQGTVVDLGCGGGQWLERLSAEGYRTCGVDRSPWMIRATKKRVPAAKLILGCMADAELPGCDVVTSLGEPVNYLPGPRQIQRTFRRVYSALRPGGLFIFDVREPAERAGQRVAARVGDDWACIARIDESPSKNLLERHITTFRQVGKHYRRHEEVHRLKLYPQSETLRWLREIGFRVRVFRGYGAYRFSEPQSAFLARKPRH